MTGTTSQEALEPLGVFVGEWSMTASLAPSTADAPRARTTFEWLPGRRFLIQRWEVEHRYPDHQRVSVIRAVGACAPTVPV